MATFKYPKTGVMLNLIDVHRRRLNAAEAETARLLRRDGHALQDIAAMLGTNQGRVCEAMEVPNGPSGGDQHSLI